MQLTQNVVIIAPDMVSYEIANALTKLMKRRLIEKEYMVNAWACQINGVKSLLFHYFLLA